MLLVFFFVWGGTITNFSGRARGKPQGTPSRFGDHPFLDTYSSGIRDVKNPKGWPFNFTSRLRPGEQFAAPMQGWLSEKWPEWPTAYEVRPQGPSD